MQLRKSHSCWMTIFTSKNNNQDVVLSSVKLRLLQSDQCVLRLHVCMVYTAYSRRHTEKEQHRKVSYRFGLSFMESVRERRPTCVAIQLFNQIRLCEMFKLFSVNCPQRHSSLSHLHLIAHFIRRKKKQWFHSTTKPK